MRAYRFLCGTVGVAILVLGVGLLLSFFSYHAPGGQALPTGPVGHYFAAFAGCALLAWGGALLGAARRPETGRTVGTATAVALVFSALYRMVGWTTGDYALLGDLLRVEAAAFLLVALAFVWLRPPHPAEAA